jgi:hypothetical protein
LAVHGRAEPNIPIPILAGLKGSEILQRVNGFSFVRKKGKVRGMKTNEYISAIAEHMANARAFTISSICDQKVSFFNRIPLEALPSLGPGERERVAPEVWQLQAIMNPPITSHASGLIYYGAINNADPEFLTESFLKCRALEVLYDHLGHPPEPTLGCS